MNNDSKASEEALASHYNTCYVGYRSEEVNSFNGLVYHGKIWKNAQPGDVVEVDQPVYVRNRLGLTSGEICGYTIYKAHDDLPFRIGLLESMTGSAYIYVAPSSSINNDYYSFEIAAHDCIYGSHSVREKVVISVTNPADDIKLIWQEETYIGEIFEGLTDRHIIHVSAQLWNGTGLVDADICQFTVVTPDMPFDVDDDGNVFNTELLDYKARHEYKFEITAEDCDGVKSNRLPVMISVKAICFVSWTGVNQLIGFNSGLSRPLLPDATLVLSSTHCNPIEVSVTVSLSGYDLDQTCQLDTASLAIQRKICGLTNSHIDLLTDTETSDGPLLNLSSGENGKITFNGMTDAIVLPPSRLDGNLGLNFVLSAWLKHEHSNIGKAVEQVLCMTHDISSSTGCQLSISIQEKCHLVFSMRPENLIGETLNRQGKLGPTLWKWRLLQVCDSLWHHYVIVVNYPQVRLFVSGKEMLDNVEIIHEWPIFSSASLLDPSLLIIGAEPHAAKHGVWHHFSGSLAGLSIFRNITLNEADVQCLSECREKLDFTAVDIMDDAMSVTVNNLQSEVTISGNRLDSVVKLVRLISYSNTRTHLMQEARNVSLKTKLVCSGGQHVVSQPLAFKLTVTSPFKLVREGDSYNVYGSENIAAEGDPHLVQVDKLSVDHVKKLTINRSFSDHWPGVITAGCVGLLALLVLVVIFVNVNHWYNNTRRSYPVNSTIHDIEPSPLSNHMTVTINPFEDQDIATLMNSRVVTNLTSPRSDSC